jgi:hypothetical protein
MAATILVMATLLNIPIDTPRYHPEAMNHSEVEFFDPRERQAEKQASRDADARALGDGEISVAQLHRKNGLLAFPKEHLSVDFAGFLELPR